jgi:hypothetical protein
VAYQSSILTIFSFNALIKEKSLAQDRRTLPKKVMLKNPLLKKSHISDAISGVVTIFGIDILVIFIALCLNVFSPVFMTVVFSIGLVQLIYLLPLLRWSVKRRVKGFSKGLLFGAIAIATINFGCFLVTFKFFSSGAR